MIEYRYAKKTDLIQVAQIHKEQFKSHYLGQFSSSLLESFYKNLLEGGFVFIVAENEGKILGFVLGGEWKKISESLNTFMRKNIVRSMFESALHPQTWKKSLHKLLSLFRQSVKDPNNLDNIEKFTLLSIATSKISQGQGIGTGLVSTFNDEMKRITNRYYLSVQDTNERAIGFYKKMGFVEAYKCEGEIQMIKTL